MNYVIAIASRYGALAIQFLIVLLITRYLTQAEAGHYFVAFGVVATAFCIAGFGLPDGLVKTVGEDIAAGRDGAVRRSITRAGFFTLASCVGLSIIGAVGAMSAGFDRVYVLLTTAWWFCYAMVFFSAQGLVALRRAGIGSFFFYTSTNLCLLGTSVPYILLAKTPDLDGVMIATVSGAGLSMLAAAGFLARQLSAYPNGDELVLLRPAFRIGFVIALARVLQAMIYWIPVWIAGALLKPEDASLIGTASRLLIAVTAVIAALRFSVRPEIVAAAARDDWKHIERLGRTISMVATASTLAAMLLLWFLGGDAIQFVFGANYAAVAPILLILMVGALGESVGGPVDEILKMTSRTLPVFAGLVATVVFEVALGIHMSHFGLSALAWSQSLAFCGMYTYQLVYLWACNKIILMPLVYPRR